MRREKTVQANLFHGPWTNTTSPAGNFCRTDRAATFRAKARGRDNRWKGGPPGI